MLSRVSVGASLVLANLLTLSAGLNSTAVQGQVKNPKQRAEAKNQVRIDPEVQSVVDLAAGVQPEFAADVLIRLAESPRVPNSAGKVLLLSKAFHRATSIEQPVRRMGDSELLHDTSAGIIASPFRLNLYRLSLQSRAVKDMIFLDAPKAHKLFDEIQFPPLLPVGCQEPLTYDVRPFYDVLTRLVHDGFSAEDKRKERHLALLEPYIGALQSHVQLEPATELLVQAGLSQSDLSQMASSFAPAMSQLRGDDRSFAIAIAGSGGHAIPEAVGRLIAALDVDDVSRVSLLQALRQYLVANFGGVRCADATIGVTNKSSLPETVGFFNQEFRALLQKFQIPPIDAQELKGLRIGDKAVIAKFWQSPESRQLYSDIMKLHSSANTGVTTAAGETPSWSSQLSDFVNELEAWHWNTGSSADAFNEKTILYEGLLDLVPAGSDRSKIIDSEVKFLEQNEQMVGATEWLHSADDLLSGFIGRSAREEIIQAFADSGNSTLNLYAQAERLAPRDERTATEIVRDVNKTGK